MFIPDLQLGYTRSRDHMNIRKVHTINIIFFEALRGTYVSII